MNPTAALLSTVAATFLLGAPVQAFDLDNMTEAERSAFGAEIRNYLLENPQVIMEAVANLEQQQAEAQGVSDIELVKVNAEALFDDGYSWVGGNPEGDVTVVEFIDYRCGYCRKANDEVAELISSDGNIRLILKEFPILGEASLTSSRFAIATRGIAGNAAYEAVHDALITLKGDVNETALRRIATDLDLDADAILAEMDSEAVTQEIGANHALAGRMQISGTPTFVMGEQMVRGYVPLANMREIVKEIRSQ